MKASVTKIIWNDWPALFAACAVPIIWIIHVAFPLLKKGASTPRELAIVLSALALVALVWRVRRVMKLFASGVLTNGIFEGVTIVKDRGRLRYSYRVGEEEFSTWCPVHKTKTVLALTPGQAIEVLYHHARPAHSVVKELFAAR